MPGIPISQAQIVATIVGDMMEVWRSQVPDTLDGKRSNKDISSFIPLA
jgi:hypothetical protein